MWAWWAGLGGLGGLDGLGGHAPAVAIPSSSPGQGALEFVLRDFVPLVKQVTSFIKFAVTEVRILGGDALEEGSVDRQAETLVQEVEEVVRKCFKCGAPLLVAAL